MFRIWILVSRPSWISRNGSGFSPPGPIKMALTSVKELRHTTRGPEEKDGHVTKKTWNHCMDSTSVEIWCKIVYSRTYRLFTTKWIKCLSFDPLIHASQGWLQNRGPLETRTLVRIRFWCRRKSLRYTLPSGYLTVRHGKIHHFS